jgi:hypothetical protein
VKKIRMESTGIEYPSLLIFVKIPMYLLLKMPARSAARKHIRICKIKIIPRT